MKTFKLLMLLLLTFTGTAFTQQRPNIILIITDDQGFGDLGFNGNPHIQTPAIDKLASESIVFNHFYVTPVCATTRSGLMTGRYNLRTGIRDTYNGGAIMASSEITFAEMLKQANYTTGIFGKWHLGDNYPSRPQDQGFDESLIHLSGGMGQVGDVTTYFKYDSSYFDPVLWHNGQKESYEGYCSDIFASEAIRFIEKNSNAPFFCYLSFNAPHTPLQVPLSYYEKYKDIDPTEGFDDHLPFPEMSEKDKEDARKVYAMVDNIDDNLGKLFQKLKDLKIEENTLVIFMTDNGPQQRRYVAGMRGRKGSVYSGGIRVPFYFKYPSLFKGHKVINQTTANIDVLPTIAEICNLELPQDRIIDGRSMLPLINNNSDNLPDRSLFFYWTRRYPEQYNNMALLKGDYKLVGNAGFNATIDQFELYNLTEDPYEQTNIISEKISLAEEMKMEMDGQYRELIHSYNQVHSPKIIIGSKYENPIILNRNDADGQRGIWAQEEIFGKWNVKIEAGIYNFKFKFIKPVAPNGRMLLETGTIIHKVDNDEESDMIEMKNVHLSAMDCELIPTYILNGKRILPFWVKIERIDL